MVGVGEEDLKQKKKAQLTICFPSQNEHFRHFSLGILSQD